MKSPKYNLEKFLLILKITIILKGSIKRGNMERKVTNTSLTEIGMQNFNHHFLRKCNFMYVKNTAFTNNVNIFS